MLQCTLNFDTGTKNGVRPGERPGFRHSSRRSTTGQGPLFLSPDEIASPATTLVIRIARPGQHRGPNLVLVDTACRDTRESPRALYVIRDEPGSLCLETGRGIRGLTAGETVIGRAIRVIRGAWGLRYVANLRLLGTRHPGCRSPL